MPHELSTFWICGRPRPCSQTGLRSQVAMILGGPRRWAMAWLIGGREEAPKGALRWHATPWHGFSRPTLTAGIGHHSMVTQIRVQFSCSPDRSASVSQSLGRCQSWRRFNHHRRSRGAGRPGRRRLVSSFALSYSIVTQIGLEFSSVRTRTYRRQDQNSMAPTSMI